MHHLLPLVVDIGLLDNTIESIIDSSKLYTFIDLLKKSHKLLSNHIVDPQTQQSHSLIAIPQTPLFVLQFNQITLILSLVRPHLLHQYILTVNQLQPLI